MTNKEIAYAFDDLANLMELHGEDEFRIRSYRNAYLALRKLDAPLAGMPDEEIKNIKGVGNAITTKSASWQIRGTWPTWKNTREKTPAGVQEMLEINGLAQKESAAGMAGNGHRNRGRTVWYACNENRLVEYKGFGLKTQEDLLQKLDYFRKAGAEQY